MFLKDLTGFYGTGERDGAGFTLEEFLNSYNAKQYDSPFNTTDIVVLKSDGPLKKWGQPLKILMVKRKNHPSIGFWATPGGFVEMHENLFDGAARELEEETGVSGLPLCQLTTWGAYDRDPRWRVITTSFLALVEGEIPVQAGDDAAEAVWFEISLQETGEIYTLTLKNEETGAEIGADVKITKTGHPLVAQEHYEIVESRGIAVDHGCLIVQALMYLKARLLSL